MATKHQPKKRTAEPAESTSLPPLPPPRKNKPLLLVAGVLVVAWIVFLLCLALHVIG
jgi:hypothetical protein